MLLLGEKWFVAFEYCGLLRGLELTAESTGFNGMLTAARR